MAGRGTDIVLGGSIEPQILKLREDETLDAEREGARDRRSCAPTGRRATTRSIKAGGLHIVGTERHESRRIDNQLRGRAGPPGRPGHLALLPVARGSAAAHLRRRAPGRHHAEAQDARGRADRASDRQPLDREGAEPRRVAQLRHPQAAARVRRRRQRPAQGHLPAAQRAARRRPTSPRRSAT